MRKIAIANRRAGPGGSDYRVGEEEINRKGGDN